MNVNPVLVSPCTRKIGIERWSFSPDITLFTLHSPHSFLSATCWTGFTYTSMPAKYSHVKRRPALGPKKKVTNGSTSNAGNGNEHSKDNQAQKKLAAHIERGITNSMMTAVSQLERAIARIFLIRFEQDIARLFSTHLYCVSLIHLPTFVMRCISVGGPGWVAYNADCEEIKDFFRSVVSMELRQSGERVATKSVLWSYTALRDFVSSPLVLWTYESASNNRLCVSGAFQ